MPVHSFVVIRLVWNLTYYNITMPLARYGVKQHHLATPVDLLRRGCDWNSFDKGQVVFVGTCLRLPASGADLRCTTIVWESSTLHRFSHAERIKQRYL